MLNDHDYVLRQIEERDIHFIRLWFTDALGNLKSLAVTDSEIEDAETAYGTKLIIVKGHILERTIVQVFSVYKAYEVRVVAYKGQEASDVTLTDEQIQMIIDFLSGMDFVEA